MPALTSVAACIQRSYYQEREDDIPPSNEACPLEESFPTLRFVQPKANGEISDDDLKETMDTDEQETMIFPSVSYCPQPDQKEESWKPGGVCGDRRT